MATTQSTTRPLHGLVVGISVSESENIAEWGYTPADVNRVTVRLSEALLAAGARLMFGHDWRPDGIMDVLCRLAVKYQPSAEANVNEPLIRSLLHWPMQSSLDPTLRAELEQRGVLMIETMPAPAGDWQSADDPIAVAIALAEMRKRLAETCSARVCIGGKEARGKHDKLSGFYAGVIEEAYRTAQADKPVYFGSFLGGASARVTQFLKSPAQPNAANATEARTDPVFQVAPCKAEAFDKMKNPLTRFVGAVLGVSASNVNGISKAMVQSQSQTAYELPEDLCSAFNNQRLQRRSELSEGEWLQMLDAPDTESFLTWVIRGLRRVVAQKTSSTNPATASDSAPETAPVTSSESPPPRKSRGRRSK